VAGDSALVRQTLAQEPTHDKLMTVADDLVQPERAARTELEGPPSRTGGSNPDGSSEVDPRASAAHIQAQADRRLPESSAKESAAVSEQMQSKDAELKKISDRVIAAKQALARRDGTSELLKVAAAKQTLAITSKDAELRRLTAKISAAKHMLATDTASELESDIARKTSQAIHDMDDVAKESAQLRGLRSGAHNLAGLSIQHTKTALEDTPESSSASSSVTAPPHSLTPAEAQRIRIEGSVDKKDDFDTGGYADGWLWGINPIFLVLGAMLLTPCLVVGVVKGCWDFIEFLCPFG